VGLLPMLRKHTNVFALQKKFTRRREFQQILWQNTATQSAINNLRNVNPSKKKCMLTNILRPEKVVSHEKNKVET
jgi:hypothetical protein